MTYGRKVQIEQNQLEKEAKNLWPGISEVNFDPEYKKKMLDNGPWQKEPEKIVWRYKNLDCMIVRNQLGALCGYVGVPKGHIAFGLNYDELGYFHDEINVHGGLTYANHCEGKICHKAKEEVYWFGFDCAHAFDFIPGSAMHHIDSGFPTRPGEVYRDIWYVKSEVEKLADQLTVIGQKEV